MPTIPRPSEPPTYLPRLSNSQIDTRRSVARLQVQRDGPFSTQPQRQCWKRLADLKHSRPGLQLTVRFTPHRPIRHRRQRPLSRGGVLVRTKRSQKIEVKVGPTGRDDIHDHQPTPSPQVVRAFRSECFPGAGPVLVPRAHEFDHRRQSRISRVSEDFNPDFLRNLRLGLNRAIVIHKRKGVVPDREHSCIQEPRHCCGPSAMKRPPGVRSAEWWAEVIEKWHGNLFIE